MSDSSVPAKTVKADLDDVGSFSLETTGLTEPYHLVPEFKEDGHSRGGGKTQGEGAALYTTYCSQCHGPLRQSNVRRASAAKITSAIQENEGGKMGSLKFLTADQIAAIASALNRTSTPTPSPTPAPTPTPTPCTLATALPSCSSCHGGSNVYPSGHAGRPKTCATCHGPVNNGTGMPSAGMSAALSGGTCVLSYPTSQGTHGDGTVNRGAAQ